MGKARSLPMPRRVLVWHSMDLPQHAYMYEGVVATLLDGFARAGPSAPTVVYGAGVRRKHKAAYQGNLSLLQSGDALIWIGYGFPDSANPWVELGRRGVRRVFYQCEQEGKTYYRNAHGTRPHDKARHRNRPRRRL